MTERQPAELVRTTGNDPTFSKNVTNDPNWTCICEHDIHQHAQVENDAVACLECSCTDFCTEADADEVTDAIYEWALEDGETWATTAYEYRQRMAQRKRQIDGLAAGGSMDE